MKNEIIERLHKIEEQEQVKILYAVESGSRAWGFESTDSDFDVRFIYVHPLDWYVSITEKKDVLDYPIKDVLDFSGWDIRKALQLYVKSNPPLYEWLVSPIVYIENGNFAQQLRDLATTNYSLETTMYNYLHMAKGENKNHLQNEKIRIKKYFYVLRPLFACMWIEKFNSQPPMEFLAMFDKLDFEQDFRKEITILLERKKTVTEKDLEVRIEALHHFIDSKLYHFEEYMKKKQFGIKPKIDSATFDRLLLEEVKNFNK